MRKALDLCSGGGGAAAGLLRHFDVVEGWDINDNSKYYPGTFNQGDVTKLTAKYIKQFDFVWASPPCQRYSIATKKWSGRPEKHPDLVEPVRRLLLRSGVPFVLENVPAAPLRCDLMLCGLMVGLPKLRRHRIFEIHGFSVPQPDHPEHPAGARYVTVAGHPGGKSTRDGTNGFGSTAEWKEAMDIDFLPARLLAEAIPPAYSDYIVSHL